MSLYLLCAGLLVAVFFAISFNVSRLRLKHGVGVGAADSRHPLTKAVHAQTNAAEYIPVFVAVFLYFAMVGTVTWVAWVAVAATAGRLLHCAGMYLSADLNKPHPARFTGSVLTYVSGLLLGLLLLARALL